LQSHKSWKDTYLVTQSPEDDSAVCGKMLYVLHHPTLVYDRSVPVQGQQHKMSAQKKNSQDSTEQFYCCLRCRTVKNKIEKLLQKLQTKTATLQKSRNYYKHIGPSPGTPAAGPCPVSSSSNLQKHSWCQSETPSSGRKSVWTVFRLDGIPSGRSSVWTVTALSWTWPPAEQNNSR